jgi:hypothetical protein
MHAAFTGAGGRVQFIDVAPFGDDGHSLFSRGISLWTPMVDSFLRDQNLGTRDIAAMPAPSPISPHRRNCATRAARDFPIISPRARTGPLPSRRRELSLSAAGAGRRVKRRRLPSPPAPSTRPIARYMHAVDDHLAETANAGSR